MIEWFSLMESICIPPLQKSMSRTHRRNKDWFSSVLKHHILPINEYQIMFSCSLYCIVVYCSLRIVTKYLKHSEMILLISKLSLVAVLFQVGTTLADFVIAYMLDIISECIAHFPFQVRHLNLHGKFSTFITKSL